MKAAAIIAALGIALIVTMGPAPASAQTTVIRECGGQYTVARYNSDGSAIGVWNKQLSDEGTIYTAGKTWKLVEGSPDRFVSDGGAQLQVVPCDAALGAGVRSSHPEAQSIQIVQGTPDTVQITFDKNLDTTSVPSTFRFTAKFSWSADFSPQSVTISGNTVSLVMGLTSLNPTLERVSYTKPSSGNLLKGADGAEVASFTFPEQTSTNPPPTTSPPVFRPPVFTGDDGRRVAPGPWISPRVNRADLSGTNVIVSMDKAVLLDTNYSTAQLADKFTVWVNGDGQAVVGASVSGYRVTLDLGSSFSAPPGARVRVNYARGPLLDAATGNTVGGFSLSPGPWTTPRPNRVYGTATGVVVSMDKPVQLDSSYSDSQIKAAFTVRVNDVSQTITKVSVSGRDISLQIESPPADGDKLAVDYTQGPLRDSTGMRILGFAYFGAGR